MPNVNVSPPSFLAPVKALFVSDSFGGILLITVTACAMLAANSSWHDGYHALFHDSLAWSPVPKLANLHLWINDGLMTLFFFVVGLEVKREVITGQLSDPQARRLPVLAAIAGMLAPALVFLMLVGDDPVLARGWAVPAATDIAFAMGIVGLLGSRLPASLRLFLLTVAIVDDIGAVIVIAVFYTASVKLAWGLGALAVFGAMMLCNQRRIDRVWVYALGAIALWICVLHSGVHATIAGVLAALALPMDRRDGTDLLEPVEHTLAPWNAYLVVPVFGFANAGVDLSGLGLESLLAPLPLAIAAGLVIGKQVGVFGAIVLARATRFAPMPEGASWIHLWGVAILCGIGFTMSLFIGTMAFPNNNLLFEQVKLGVLSGTVVAVLLGYLVLRFAPQGETGTTADRK